MISRSATETATQACSEAAISASPIHSADANQMLSIPNPFVRPSPATGVFGSRACGGQNETRQSAGYKWTPPRIVTQQESSALAGGYGELHPLAMHSNACPNKQATAGSLKTMDA